jgi:hypothetical protein
MIVSDATMSSVARRGMTTFPCHIHQLVVHLLVVRFLITLKTFCDLVCALLTWSAFENRNYFLTKRLSLKSPHFVVPPSHFAPNPNLQSFKAIGYELSYKKFLSNMS